jgi:transcriptional regulator with PAS, ATPase and Fis domain
MNISQDYELLLEHILGLMVIDTKKNVIYMNDQCAEYIEVDREHSIGKPIEHVFPPSTMADLLASDEDADSDFYFSEGRISFSRRMKLKKDDHVIGVIEYDLLQEINSLKQFIDKYTHT